MKFNKISRRLAAALMAGAMVVSMVGMTAFAASSEEKVAKITKQITKDENVYAPKTDFTFTITPGTAVPAAPGQDAIYAGVADWVSIVNDGVISSEPKESDIGQTTITAGEAAITVTVPEGTVPGIYRYVVKETAGSYEGVGYTEEEKFFDVYVTTEGTTFMFTDSDSETGKDDGVFTNEYGTGSVDGQVNDLTVTKVVAGNQGDRTKGFTFTLNVNGADGEQYYVVYGENQSLTLAKNTDVTITLKDGESATIYGLSASDTYTVTEADYSADGYRTTIGGTETNVSTGTITADTTVTVTNTKNVTTPTGIAMTIAPYILMVALAGVFAFLFLRRRNRADY